MKYENVMNEKGYFLVYDALIGIIILTTLIGLGYYIFDNEHVVYEVEDKYIKPSDILVELKNTNYEDENILSILSYKTDNNINTTDTISKINNTINTYAEYYTFTDTTGNKTLLDYPKKRYKNTYASHIIVDKHIYELKIYT